MTIDKPDAIIVGSGAGGGTAAPRDVAGRRAEVSRQRIVAADGNRPTCREAERGAHCHALLRRIVAADGNRRTRRPDGTGVRIAMRFYAAS